MSPPMAIDGVPGRRRKAAVRLPWKRFKLSLQATAARCSASATA